MQLSETGTDGWRMSQPPPRMLTWAGILPAPVALQNLSDCQEGTHLYGPHFIEDKAEAQRGDMTC